MKISKTTSNTFCKIFTKTYTYNGTIRKYDIYEINYKIFKTITCKFFGIPYFYNKTDKLNKKDFEILNLN